MRTANARVGEVPGLQRRLNSAATVGDLLARACVEAPKFSGFERGLVVGIDEGRLTATGIETIADPASDDLRRRCLANPIELTRECEEVELIRRAEGGRDVDPVGGSVLDAALALDEYVIATVAPEIRVIALVVVDRPAPAASDDDRCAVELFAHLLGVALERAVLRLRLQELAAELRHLTASAHALMNEALEAPVALTADFGHGPVFTTAGRFASISGDLSEILNDREREIAALMANGRSNREIGEELHLSPDTVKAHLARLVRKLGASNRVEAAARYASMSHDPK